MSQTKTFITNSSDVVQRMLFNGFTGYVLSISESQNPIKQSFYVIGVMGLWPNTTKIKNIIFIYIFLLHDLQSIIIGIITVNTKVILWSLFSIILQGHKKYLVESGKHNDKRLMQQNLKVVITFEKSNLACLRSLELQATVTYQIM